jgi:hypothetical protein
MSGCGFEVSRAGAFRDALDRVSGWIDAHPHAPDVIAIVWDKDCGACVSFGFRGAESAKKLFPGYPATVDHKSSMDEFVVVDHDWSLKFSWDVFRKSTPTTEEVVL